MCLGTDRGRSESLEAGDGLMSEGIGLMWWGKGRRLVVLVASAPLASPYSKTERGITEHH